ncbi:MAG TPA: amino acid adenylation domain-containing protein, partial [Acetobacteraceae bacterium]
MQGAWAVVLGRMGNRRQAIFGTTVAGRPAGLPESGQMLGLFINSLPIWVNLPSSMQLTVWLQDLQRRNSALRDHEHTPLVQIQNWAGHAGESLFDSLLVFENYPLNEAIRSDTSALKLLDASFLDRTHYPLTLTVLPRSELELDWEWDGERLERSAVESLSAAYVQVLRQFIASDDLRLGEITLSDGPVPGVLASYAFMPVVERIVAQAAVRPAAEALVCEGERLSYAELAGWSGRIAWRLAGAGVAADERVGLCVARSPAMVAGLLGVLRSGGAYVPLDPAYPAERLRLMIEDAGVRTIVADPATAAQLATVLQGYEIVLTSEAAEDPPAGWRVDVHPDQLAYVIYTSGSTGRPKGVAVSHAALNLHLGDFIGHYGISDTDTVLHSSTINFDVALHEILPALTQGGCVVMRGPSLWDLATLTATLRNEAVTFARIPTAYWQQWLHVLPDDLPALRQVTVGGEALAGDALQRWQDGPLRHVKLDNLYGPTETTVAALARVTTPEDAHAVIVPIGVPWPGRSGVVMDLDGNAAPVGGLGELCIGGASLARGYIGRPGLTAERFVPDPYTPGGRLYRTGDLCRQQADGTIAFLGRLDQQVKLRGHRIELGEIEAALRHCAGVRDAVVALRGEGETRTLAAYAAGTADAATLKQALEQSLPGYMVPATVTVLDALPLMPNGKIDRAALPAPEQAAAGERIAPRTAAEAALLAIWSAVLKREDLGVTDNFFEVGGDSILSLQIIARARDAGLRLTPRQVFEHPTIEAAAALAAPTTPEPTATATGGTIPLTPIQRSFFAAHPDGPAHWNQAVLLRSTRPLDPDAVQTVLRTLIARHDALRLRFDRTPEGWTQRVTESGQFRFAAIDLRGTA